MLTIRQMLGLFFGKVPISSFAGERISIGQGALTFALAYFSVSVLLAGELVILSLAYGFLANTEIVALLVSTGIVLFTSLIIVFVSFFAYLVSSYIWGAIHFFIARFFSNKPDRLNDFNGSVLSVFASVKLVKGIFFLIPVVGWLFSIVVHLYGLVLLFRFVKARLNLTDSQATIVVLLPFNLALFVLLVIAVIVSFALLGSRIV